MQEFNLEVTITVTSKELAQVTVEAETLDEAKEIAERMFERGELSFEIVDSEIHNIFISEE